MTRTKTAPEPATEPPPDPPTEQARPSPVLAWPAEWPVPELPEDKPRRTRRGLPMAPALAGAGNATALTTTAAYSAGGPVAAAATGVVIVAGATAATLRRRATVKAGRATASRLRSGGGSAPRSGSGAGSGRSGSGSGRSGGGGRSGDATRSGSGTRGSSWRSGSGSSSPAPRSGSRSAPGGSSPQSRGGLFGKGGSGRHTGPGRHRLDGGRHGGDSKRRQKKADAATQKAAQKAARKALKQAAKNLAAKNTAAKTGKTGKGHALKAAAGRATRAAWNATRPKAGRALRATRGATWDGLRAVAAGAWTWLRTRDRKAALGRLKNVWARHRKARNTPPASQPQTPAVAATVRRPTHASPTPRTGGTPMSGGGHHFVAPAMELARAAANYQPTGMLQVGADFAGLEEALRLHAEAMKITVENADAHQPLDPRIVDIMRQIHGLQLKAAELAADLQPAFEQLHNVDLARLRNPRKGAAGERMWDVSANI